MLQLRPAVLQRLQARPAPLTGINVRLELLLQSAQRRRLPGFSRNGHAVVQTAGRLNEPGARYVGHVQHQARRKGQKAATAVGFGVNDRRRDQPAFTHANALAQLHAQAVQHLLVHPDLARSRACALDAARQQHLAAQRVSRIHRLHRHQARCAVVAFVGTHHAGEGRDMALLQPQFRHALAPAFGGGAVGRDHQVTADQLRRIAAQTALQSVAQKGHCAHRRHSQSHPQHQQPQLPGTRVAPEAKQHLFPERWG